MSLGQYKFCEMNYKNTSSSEDYAFGNCTQKTAVLIVTFPNRSAGRVCLQCRLRGRLGFDPWVGMILWGRKWQTTPVFLPGESHGLITYLCYWWAPVHGVAKSQPQMSTLAPRTW